MLLVLLLYSDAVSLTHSHVASIVSLLCFWYGKVPGGILGTLPHGPHQPSEAHVLGFLQPTHEPLLHDGYELPITKLSVPWGRQTGGERMGSKGDRQGRDNEIIEE